MHSTWSWEFRRVIQNCRDPMKPAQVIRIVLLLAAIFAAGVVTGRLTAPKPPALVVRTDGLVVTSDAVLARLKRELHLTAGQERQFRTLLEELAREMSPIPPGSNERLMKFRSYVPRMETLLRPEQRADFDHYVSDTEARFKRAIRAQTPQRNAPP